VLLLLLVVEAGSACLMKHGNGNSGSFIKVAVSCGVAAQG